MPSTGVPDRKAASIRPAICLTQGAGFFAASPRTWSTKGKCVEFLYQDEHLVAVSKPAGLLVHRTNLDRHATTSALQLVRNRLERHVYPVHRLDRPTSGVLLFALSPETAQTIAAEFAARRVSKRYLAVVRGCVDEQGMIDHPLAEDTDRMEGSRNSNPIREAVTEYRRLAAAELPFAVGRYPTSRYSLVEMRPVTGRRHQLRRHFKHFLHPIIGDTRYGEGRHNRFFRSELDCERLLLAAVELSLRHPSTGEPFTIDAPLDETFAAVVERLGWHAAVPSQWLKRRE